MFFWAGWHPRTSADKQTNQCACDGCSSRNRNRFHNGPEHRAFTELCPSNTEEDQEDGRPDDKDILACASGKKMNGTTGVIAAIKSATPIQPACMTAEVFCAAVSSSPATASSNFWIAGGFALAYRLKALFGEAGLRKIADQLVHGAIGIRPDLGCPLP